jgi:diaminopimelate epimerase
MRFAKYHGLGNDYVVIEAADLPASFGPAMVRRICDRHFGIGSDGILIHGATPVDGTFHLRICNPDGSEAEKSGNGLRIFARYLWDRGLVAAEPFAVATRGGRVQCQVLEAGRFVTVQMGRANFGSTAIPVAGPDRQVLREPIIVAGESLEYSAVTVGNPHCVLIRSQISEGETRRLGPLLECDPRFPNRTNVQFVRVRDAGNIEIQVWERGAGYTLASGSSSCAAAAVCRRLGLCGCDVHVHMPGGTLGVQVSEEFDLRMTGPVVKVAAGELCLEMFHELAAGSPQTH